MEYKRLTTDKPINSAEASLNFAVAKNGTTVLRAAGGEEDINLCEYLFEEAKKHGYNCVSSADDILQGDCLACDCIINVLYIVAVQAAELRERLKEFEDKIEKGELVEQKQGEWISFEDRLPNRDELVLCIGAKGGMFLGEIKRIYPFDKSAYAHVPNSNRGRYAKYWQPLPTPPKTKGAENG